MFRLAALNKQTSGETSDQNDTVKGTKEAQEAHAFELYNYALQLQRDQHHDDAIQVYEDLLDTSLVTHAATNLVDENGEAMERPLKDPGLILKYSTHKNMASMSAERGDINAAMEHYLQAVMLDTTDVTLWQCIGTHAISLGRLALARHAFISGLKCNENHWPCLDSAVTVLYALLDYENCLYWIAKALEKDPEYVKGLALRKQMFRECPHLRRDSQDLFNRCSFSIYDAVLDDEEFKQYVDDALQLRSRHRELCRPKPAKTFIIDPRLHSLTWLCLGKSIVSSYDVIKDSQEFSFKSPVSFGNLQDLKDKLSKKENKKKGVVFVDEIVDASQNKENNFIGDADMKDDDNAVCDVGLKVSGQINDDVMTESSSKENDQLKTSLKPATDEENSVTSQTAAEDWTGFSEDSVGSVIVSDASRGERYVDSVALSQDIFSAPDSCQRVVRDVIDDLLNAVSSPPDDAESSDVVRGIIDNIITMVTEFFISDEEIIFDLVQEMIEDVNQQPNLSCGVDEEGSGNEDVAGFSLSRNNNQVINGCTEQEKLKKASKKKKFSLDSIIEEHMMRRSSRVRTSSKKRSHQDAFKPTPTEKDVDYKKKITELLPSSLKQLPPASENIAVDDEEYEDTAFAPHSASTNMLFSESDDVFSFVQNNEGNFITAIIRNYCYSLAKTIHRKWEAGTSEVLSRIFARTRSHVILPCLSEDSDAEQTKKFLFDLLSCIECQVDCYPKKIPDAYKLQDLDECFEYLASAGTYEHIFEVTDAERNVQERSLERDWKVFTIRLLWARSKHSMNLAKTLHEIGDLKTCKEILQKIKAIPDSTFDSYVIHLPNTDRHSVICVNTAEVRLHRLERAQVLENASAYFEQELYSEVVKLLEPTVRRQRFHKPSSNHKRPRQIRQFLLSCQQIHDYKRIFESCGYLLLEVISNIDDIEQSKQTKKRDNLAALTPGKKQANDLSKQWSGTLHVTLQVLNRSLTAGSKKLSELIATERSVLTYSVVEVLRFMLSRLDNSRIISDIALVWILLYKIVAEEEEEIDLSCCQDLPDSFLLLQSSHQWMGEKNLCCVSDGQLLKFILSESERRFSCVSDSAMKDEIDSELEQCFFCLYAYPNKTKPRGMQDHSAKQITLTWNDCLTIFRHFRQEYLPEFDSYKASALSFDLSQLLLRALPLVPNHVMALIPNSEMDVASYIEGGCEGDDVLKSSPTDADLLALSEMYYLLADYFFKNNEMTKAVKYYLLDVRINPTRFDSWAGMALARSSQTDDRLRLCEPKKPQHKVKNSGTERRGLAALACFKRALSFESNSVKLWIEYGSLAYWMHSMYSRKWKRKGSINTGENKKMAEMLKLSRRSFESISECESDEIHEDEWLIQYMLGKLAEKEKKPLKEYIQLYQSSAVMLHHRHAKYPKKILAKCGYVNDLAIEALEMYFRIHASILKYVLSCPSVSTEDVLFMKDTVEELANSPFARRQELKSAVASSQESEKTSKLAVTSQSSDLTMGSLLPDNILQALNIEETKTDDDNDTQSTVGSTALTSGEQFQDESNTRGQSADSASLTMAVAQPMDHIIADAQNVAETPQSADVMSEMSDETRGVECDAIVDACEAALCLCVRRFPHHNKALYRLAHLYAKCESRKRLTWARDLLYGSSSPWQQLSHMCGPGLLADRNKTNLFNGVWRIPMDDIDRPGSFSAHLYRCVALLLEVLCELRQSETLLHIHNLLHRTPEHGRKYLREEDRIVLARRSLVLCRATLNRKLQSLSSTTNIVQPQMTSVGNGKSATESSNQQRPPPASDSLRPESCPITQTEPVIMQSNDDNLSVLLEAYKVYQDTQKHSDATTNVDTETDPDDMTQQRILADAYHKYTCRVPRTNKSPSSSSDSQALFEEAIRFCQQQISLKKTVSASTNPKSTPSVTPSSKLPSSVFKPMQSSYLGENLTSVREDDDMKVGSGENGISQSQIDDKPAQGKVTMVKKEGITYTRIGPPRTDYQRRFAPSPDSAFRYTAPLGGGEGKRLRMDPGLKHLQGVNDPSKNRLVRSTSVPVSYPDGEENTPPQHRPLYRTGSFVSDYTKLRLKTTILAKTSAALVRKPSITDLEMMQIHGDPDDADSDSSQSEDEDDEVEGPTNQRKRKYSDDAPPSVSTNEHPPLVPPIQSTVITTAGST